MFTSAKVIAASIIEINPGLTFWTLVTFLILFFVLRWKVWGPFLQMLDRREKAIAESLDSAKHERDAAEQMLAEQKRATVEARREVSELVRKNQAEAEQMRQELLAASRKEADALLATARRQIDEEKRKVLAELRGQAVELAIAGAQRLIESSLDEGAQRKIVADYLKELETKRPVA